MYVLMRMRSGCVRAQRGKTNEIMLLVNVVSVCVCENMREDERAPIAHVRFNCTKLYKFISIIFSDARALAFRTQI